MYWPLMVGDALFRANANKLAMTMTVRHKALHMANSLLINFTTNTMSAERFVAERQHVELARYHHFALLVFPFRWLFQCAIPALRRAFKAGFCRSDLVFSFTCRCTLPVPSSSFCGSGNSVPQAIPKVTPALVGMRVHIVSTYLLPNPYPMILALASTPSIAFGITFNTNARVARASFCVSGEYGSSRSAMALLVAVVLMIKTLPHL